jgi:predicted transcriptional regulator of viral defense system
MSQRLFYHPLYTTQRLLDAGFTFRTIQDLIDQQKIVRVKRGLYVPADRIHHQHECAFSLFDKALFCLMSAAFVYGYVYQQPKQIYIAANKNESRIKYRSDFLDIKTMYRDNKYFMLGYDQTVFNGHHIHITDRERTVLDCIRHRNMIGSLAYHKVIEGYIEDPKKDVIALICYAKKMRIFKKVKLIFEPWIEDFTLLTEKAEPMCVKINAVVMDHEA